MPDTTTLRDRILAEARARFGIPYGLPPGQGQTDCSLYVRDVYEAAGLPFSPGVRVAEAERQDTVPIDINDVLPGDLLFFEKTYNVPGQPGPDGKIASHIGISLGAGTRRMYDANDGRGNSGETNIGTPYWQEHLLEARRHPALMADAAPAPVPGRFPRGIDVASYQGNPDWSAVTGSGIAFAITKVTEDEDYLNPTFVRNWVEIKAAGLVRGAYHFARPESATDAIEEADHFIGRLETVGGVQDGDILALDMESGTGDLGQWTLDFLRRVEQRAGVRPIIYTGEWFSDPHELDLKSELAAYPLWLANYPKAMTDPPTWPRPAAPWPRVAIWQHSSSGRVPGIVGDVDLNIFNGTLEQLRALGKGGAATKPPQEPSFVQPGDVGSGLLTMMAKDGTQPAMPSTFLPLGRSPAMIEECQGMNGTIYRWHLPTGQHWRIRAAA